MYYTERVYNASRFFLFISVWPCLSKNPKYTFYTIKSSLTLAYYIYYYYICWTLFSAHCLCYIHIDTTSSACDIVVTCKCRYLTLNGKPFLQYFCGEYPTGDSIWGVAISLFSFQYSLDCLKFSICVDLNLSLYLTIKCDKSVKCEVMFSFVVQELWNFILVFHVHYNVVVYLAILCCGYHNF